MVEPMTSSYEQVLEEHREQRRMVADIGHFLSEARPEPGGEEAYCWACELSRRLQELHSHLCTHFRFEEESGILKELASSFPRAHRACRQLAREHPRMLRELRSLTTDAMRFAEVRPGAGPGLRRRTAKLLDTLDEHERRETELLARLYNEDIGLGD